MLKANYHKLDCNLNTVCTYIFNNSNCSHYFIYPYIECMIPKVYLVKLKFRQIKQSNQKVLTQCIYFFHI